MINKVKNNIIISVCVVLLVFISFALIYVGYSLYKELKEYDEINIVQEQIVNEVVEKKENTTEEKKEFSINWNKLLSINSDVVAWIRIPETNVNYHIVKGISNKQYLRTNIYGNYSRGGTVFVDYHIDNPFTCSNTIIYGHNLMNGSMFSDLKKYSKKDYFENHKYIYIYLPDGNTKKYEIMAFHTVKANDTNVFNPYVNNLSEYKDYMFSNNQIDNNNMDIDDDDAVITLVTCTNYNKNTRYVLHALLIEDER